LLTTIFDLVTETEATFAALVGEREFEQLRATLGRLADAIDPGGAFGVGDEQPAKARKSRTSGLR
jgi:hypothetical protein